MDKPYYEMRFYVYGHTNRMREPTPEEREALNRERETGERVLISDEFEVDLDVIESEYTDDQTRAFQLAKEYLKKGDWPVTLTDYQTKETTTLDLCSDCGALIDWDGHNRRCEECNFKEWQGSECNPPNARFFGVE